MVTKGQVSFHTWLSLFHHDSWLWAVMTKGPGRARQKFWVKRDWTCKHRSLWAILFGLDILEILWHSLNQQNCPGFRPSGFKCASCRISGIDLNWFSKVAHWYGIFCLYFPFMTQHLLGLQCGTPFRGYLLDGAMSRTKNTCFADAAVCSSYHETKPICFGNNCSFPFMSDSHSTLGRTAGCCLEISFMVRYSRNAKNKSVAAFILMPLAFLTACLNLSKPCLYSRPFWFDPSEIATKATSWYFAQDSPILCMLGGVVPSYCYNHLGFGLGC